MNPKTSLAKIKLSFVTVTSFYSAICVPYCCDVDNSLGADQFDCAVFYAVLISFSFRAGGADLTIVSALHIGGTPPKYPFVSHSY